MMANVKIKYLKFRSFKIKFKKVKNFLRIIHKKFIVNYLCQKHYFFCFKSFKLNEKYYTKNSDKQWC